jgi:hypothetical protein
MLYFYHCFCCFVVFVIFLHYNIFMSFNYLKVLCFHSNEDLYCDLLGYDTTILEVHTASVFSAEGGGSKFLWKTDIHLQDYNVIS